MVNYADRPVCTTYKIQSLSNWATQPLRPWILTAAIAKNEGKKKNTPTKSNKTQNIHLQPLQNQTKYPGLTDH